MYFYMKRFIFFSLTVLHNIGCISIYFFYFIIHSANVASSNLAHGEVNLRQRYLMHFLSVLWQVGGFFLTTPVS